jgi:hypothetical protein
MSEQSLRLKDMAYAIGQALLKAPGDTPRDLREEVVAAARAVARGETPRELPSPLADLVRAMVSRPTDADLKSVLDAGHSEDAVLELALAAAYGRGVARLELGLAALEDE